MGNNKVDILSRWTKEKSEELYGVKNWGKRYFSISDKGEVLVNPFRTSDKAVSLMDIVSGVREQGLALLGILLVIIPLKNL